MQNRKTLEGRVPGYDGKYLIKLEPGSRVPRIWDTWTGKERKITWTGKKGQKKYGMVTLNGDKLYVARILGELFLPYEPCLEDYSMKYRDKDTTNLKIENLYWGIKTSGRYDPTVYVWEHVETGEKFHGVQSEAVKKFGTFCSAITRQKAGIMQTTKGWRFLGREEKNTRI